LWTLLIDFFACWDIAQDEGSPKEGKTSFSQNHKSLATPPQTINQSINQYKPIIHHAAKD
jgi:hypothetical protein